MCVLNISVVRERDTFSVIELVQVKVHFLLQDGFDDGLSRVDGDPIHREVLPVTGLIRGGDDVDVGFVLDKFEGGKLFDDLEGVESLET